MQYCSDGLIWGAAEQCCDRLQMNKCDVFCAMQTIWLHEPMSKRKGLMQSRAVEAD